ncbi:MAG TPA: helicase HerA-like domain-containing protein, partial [Cryobacterium sp.]|nr:helicase HerA-like domain-containing protein [Cryobacterium sp.]
VRAPQGSMSPVPPERIDTIVAASPLLARYGTATDRDSAHEMLATRLEAANRAAQAAQETLDRAEAAAAAEREGDARQDREAKAEKKAQAEYDRLMRQTQPGTRTRTTARPQKSVLEQVLGSSVTKSILTGVVGGIFGTRRRR